MTQTITRPSLPGEPELPGESNAKAKLASIVAAHQLEIWANDRDTVLSDWSDLRSSMSSAAPDILELLADYDVAEGDCNRDVIDDVIWQFKRKFEVSERSSWHEYGTEPDGPREFRIRLSYNGPSCLIYGKIERSGLPLEDIKFCFSWGLATQLHELPLSTDESEAVWWLCDSLVC